MTTWVASSLIVLLTCLAWAAPRFARPTLPFGVQVAAARADDPAIVRTRQRYSRWVVAVALVAVVVCLAVDDLIVSGVIANGLLVVHMALYGLAHQRIRTVKRREWWQAEHRYGVTTDTTFRTDPVRVPILWLLPSVAVLVASMLLGRWEIVVPIAVMTVLAPICVRALVRARPDLDAARPVASARKYRAYLEGTARLLLLGVAAVNLPVLLFTFPGWEVVANVLLGAACLAIVVWTIRVGQAGHRLPSLPGEEDEDTGLTQRDDDRYWHLAGTVYVNRQDPAVLVHQRVGMVWTMNLGHPVTWVLLAALAVVAALAGFGVVDLPDRGNLR
ncbi:DUF5808 domain-containing protein [Kibdelosporangium persicum]|uniref:Cytochrome c-type biogenesis protein DsbD, protein-disulfide reductase n=1 Tax=Kibdelosporangium persicum TaxID=2698649 RepID=A0ABX2F6F4_9PSEU|nr:DUF5808 domain-containing protein [Kibdelosporangium persicum]NRN66734.1 Cytochrome c-type biogenesis protein DsbD, protein-disulfide reductase [Kibdelosporangium persicum]